MQDKYSVQKRLWFVTCKLECKRSISSNASVLYFVRYIRANTFAGNFQSIHYKKYVEIIMDFYSCMISRTKLVYKYFKPSSLVLYDRGWPRQR